MKYVLILLAIPLLAAVQIHSVYYDPIHSQNYGEFVTLYNPTTQPINITGYQLHTTISQADATLSGVIEAKSTYLITDKNFSEYKDNTDWPTPNHQESITLRNTDGFVRLLDALQQEIDVVGWQDAQYFQTTSHPGADEGEALIRVSDTNNNADDFVSKTPQFDSKYETQTALHIQVTNHKPQVRSYYTDKDTLTVTIQDNNTLADVQVYVQNTTLIAQNSSATRTNFTAQLPALASMQEITLQITDVNTTYTHSLVLEQTPRMQIQIPQNISLQAQPHNTVTTSIPVTNTGETPVNILVKGTAPVHLQQHIGNVTYTVNGHTQPLTTAYHAHEVHLQPQEEIEVHVHVTTTHALARAYLGKILIAAITP